MKLDGEGFKKHMLGVGRARRREFWMFAFAMLVAAIFLQALVATLASKCEALRLLIANRFFMYAVLVAYFTPLVSAAIRRLHDSGRSGWWIWIWLIPIVGSAVLLVFFCLGSEPGTNKYGVNPRSTTNGVPKHE